LVFRFLAVARKSGASWRFKDNGVYVGHDEPPVKFISSAPGSGNDMTCITRLSAGRAG
jgi:hypothetical protein